jgi:hypothetical protein
MEFVFEDIACPICHEMLSSPSVHSDGRTYDSTCFGEWKSANGPGAVLSPCTLTPLDSLSIRADSGFKILNIRMERERGEDDPALSERLMSLVEVEDVYGVIAALRSGYFDHITTPIKCLTFAIEEHETTEIAEILLLNCSFKSDHLRNVWQFLESVYTIPPERVRLLLENGADPLYRNGSIIFDNFLFVHGGAEENSEMIDMIVEYISETDNRAGWQFFVAYRRNDYNLLTNVNVAGINPNFVLNTIFICGLCARKDKRFLRIVLGSITFSEHDLHQILAMACESGSIDFFNEAYAHAVSLPRDLRVDAAKSAFAALEGGSGFIIRVLSTLLAEGDEYVNTLIRLAARHYKAEVLKYLVEQGYGNNFKESELLNYIFRRGNEEAVEFVISLPFIDLSLINKETLSRINRRREGLALSILTRIRALPQFDTLFRGIFNSPPQRSRTMVKNYLISEGFVSTLSNEKKD